MGLENPIHLMIVLLVVLLVFGAKRLPDMGRSMGEGMRGFKDAISGDSSTSSHNLAAVTAAPPVNAVQPLVSDDPAATDQPSAALQPVMAHTEHTNAA